MMLFQGDVTYADTQMPKHSRTQDRERAMVGEGSIKAKPSDTGKGKGKGSQGINIPLADISPELKKILVREMIKGGKAKLIKKQGGKKGK